MADGIRNYLFLAAILTGTAVTQYVPAVSDYLLMRWMVFGLGGAVFLSLLLLAQGRQIDPLARLHWLLLIVYLLHQFEEHGMDLFGRSYAFLAYANTTLEDVGLADNFTFTPEVIYNINILTVWLSFPVAVWGGRRFLWPGLAAAGIILTNGVFHIAGGLIRSEYNPGLGTSIVLFLPVAFVYFRHVQRHCGIGTWGIAGALLYGAGLHAALFLNIRLGVAPDFPAPLLAMVTLSPLIANVVYAGIRNSK